MKKIILFLVLGILVLSGLAASAIKVDNVNINIDNNDKLLNENTRATHTVLGEYGTATWCPYCKYGHGALKELYAEGQLDFYYISHVQDKNTVSASYLKSHYNLYGFPTVWWDGGFRINIGAGSIPGAKSSYTSSITQSLSRSVYDVDIDLAVTWLGGTKMKVVCSVNNNEAFTYNGTIQVAICEKESSMGWTDKGGVIYTMAFLDWAFKETLTIPSGGSWSDTVTWDGSSHGYSKITRTNIFVIAAAYNKDWHQGYSYTPPNNPFDAYYVDECVAKEPTKGKTTDIEFLRILENHPNVLSILKQLLKL